MKILLIVSIMCCTISTFSQEIKIPVVKDQQYYSQKSKKQMTAGLITLGVGLGLFALTATYEKGIDNIGTSVGLIGLGGVATTTGIVLLISSAGNKAKAKRTTAFIGAEKTMIAQNRSMQQVFYPQIGIRVNVIKTK